MRIGELAGRLDVSTDTVRFYERAVPDLEAGTAWPLTFLALAPFAVFPLHDIEARCFL